MHASGHRAVLVALAVVLVATTGASAADSDANEGTRITGVDERSEPVVTERITVSNASGDTAVVEYEYRIPAGVDRLVVSHADAPQAYPEPTTANLEVLSSSDYGGTYEWTGNETESGTATLRFRVALQTESVDAQGPGVAGDGWQFLNLPWVTVQRPTEVETERRVASESGFTTPERAYVGAYDEVTERVDNQTLHLVVPPDADLHASRDAVLDSLVDAARRFPNVDDDPHVYAVALPAHIESSWGGNSRDAAFWVDADSRPSGPDNTWVHEYVHTQQAGSLTSTDDWFTEASAEYYAASLSAYGGDPEDARDHVAEVGHPDAVLTEADTNDHRLVEYKKGSRVYAALDARIRRATNGSASALDLFRDVYGEDGPLLHSEFRALVADYLGEEATREFFDKYVAGSDVPEMPERHVVTLTPTGDADDDGVSNWQEERAGRSPFGEDAGSDLPTRDLVVAGTLLAVAGVAGAGTVVVALARIAEFAIDRSPGILRRRSLARLAGVAVAASVAFAVYASLSV